MYLLGCTVEGGGVGVEVGEDVAYGYNILFSFYLLLNPIHHF